jgi:hypothetical protein
MAQNAFNEAGDLIDEGAAHSLKSAARQLVETAQRLGEP